MRMQWLMKQIKNKWHESVMTMGVGECERDGRVMTILDVVVYE